MQNGVGELQEFVAKYFFALQKRMEDYCVRMCYNSDNLLAERILIARENQSGDTGQVACLYAER